MRSRSFVALYIAVFVATMGVSMVSPLLPVYAKELGANGVWLGLTFSSFAIAQTIFGPFSGSFSDRFGRKRMIIVGLLIYCASAIGYLTANNFYQVIGFRAFSGLGTSLVFSLSRAYVGDLTPRGQEGRWLGVFATADIVGFGTGPTLAGLLRQTLGFESVFVVMAILMATSAFILLVWLPRHSPREAERHSGSRDTAPSMTIGTALRERLVLAVTAHEALLSVAAGASLSFLGIRLGTDLGVAPLLVGFGFTIQNLAGGIAQPAFGVLSDRYNRRLLAAAGLVMSGCLTAFIGVVPTFGLALVLLFLIGASNALSQVPARAIQLMAGRKAGMGTVLGIGSAANGAGIVIGSLVGGYLKDTHGMSTTFAAGGAVMVIGAPLFLLLTAGLKTSERDAR